MAWFRDIVYGSAAVVASPIWVARLLHTGKWRTDWAARFGRTEPLKPTARKRLLIHAVSVGEVNLIRSLVAQLEADHIDVVIAATTNTGYARAMTLYHPRHAVLRYPLDFTAAVNGFLDAVSPDAVALVELEVWPNFMEACDARAIPVAIINGRLSARSFKNYLAFRPLIRRSFERIAVAAVQTQDYANRFEQLGALDVRVLDTMKWDAAAITDEVDGADQLAREMGVDRSRRLVVAGSTSPGEDQLLIDAMPPDVQLLLAPRKPEWFDAVMACAPGIVRRTQPQASGSGGQASVFLLDTIGELRKAYALADVAIVGRSFTGRLYGSDMTEPIALGKPTIIGPHYSDFAWQMQALLQGGGILVTDRPGDAVRDLLGHPQRAAKLADAGRRVIQAHQGATDRHANLLRQLLKV